MNEQKPKPMTVAEVSDLLKTDQQGELTTSDGLSITMQEFRERFNRQPTGERPCRRCKKPWTPTGWNFYDLCEECHIVWQQARCYDHFKGYDEAGHMILVKNEKRYESCDLWIKDNPI